MSENLSSAGLNGHVPKPRVGWLGPAEKGEGGWKRPSFLLSRQCRPGQVTPRSCRLCPPDHALRRSWGPVMWVQPTSCHARRGPWSREELGV